MWNTCDSRISRFENCHYEKYYKHHFAGAVPISRKKGQGIARFLAQLRILKGYSIAIIEHCAWAVNEDGASADVASPIPRTHSPGAIYSIA
ncbi:MAG: hypothetical protein R6U13_09255 [Desulfatiglandaceae bacterium]